MLYSLTQVNDFPGGSIQSAEQSWIGHRNKSGCSWGGKSEHIAHVELTGLHPVRQLPRETMEEVSHSHLKRIQSELHARARPPTRPERDELEVAPLEVRHVLVQKTTRLECLRVGP